LVSNKNIKHFITQTPTILAIVHKISY